MKIINIHKRQFDQPTTLLADILDTIGSDNDRLWPKEKWPRVNLDDRLEIHSSGGHGPIGYYVSLYDFGRLLEFTFTSPEEFIGKHSFEIIDKADGTSELLHRIDMSVNLKGSIIWYCAVKWLHDALLEDCLDKVHNQLAENRVHTPHTFWVKTLRYLLR